MKINLDSSATLLTVDREALESIGISFTADGEHPALNIKEGLELEGLERQLAALPNAGTIATKLASCIEKDSPFYPVLRKTDFLLTLKEQAGKTEAELLGHPFAFDLPNTQEEIVHQMQELRQQGIDDVQIGMEVEFSFPHEPKIGSGKEQLLVGGFTKAAEIQAEAVKKLEQEFSEAGIEQQSIIRAKIDAIKTFTPREILMYDLIECDARTKHILEPLFGTGRDGDGYYDAVDGLELKLKPASPEKIIQNRKALIKVLMEKAGEYGLVFEENPMYHVSFSFWAKDKNILDSRNDQFDTYAPGIVKGVGKVISEAAPVAHSSEYVYYNPENPIAVTADRETLVRYASGRFEVRLSNQVPDTIIPIILAGAASGLSKEKTDKFDMLPAKKARSPRVKHSPGAHKMIAHLLNGSTLTDEGMLIAPYRYLTGKVLKIMQDLGIPPEGNYSELSGVDKGLMDGLIKFFSKVKVANHAGRYEIIWPTTAEGSYAITTDTGSEVRIDVKNLRRNIHADGIAEKYITDGAYPLPTIRSGNYIPAQVMLRSPFLNDALSEEFMRDLTAETQSKVRQVHCITL
jgi:hypothetical protein